MDARKIAPSLLAALNEWQNSGHAGIAPHRNTLGIVSEESVPKPARSVVFLRCRDDADLTHLGQYGAVVNQTQGHIRTAILPLHSLDPISEDPDVDHIIGSHYLQPRLDAAAEATNLPVYRGRTNLTGKGVIVGIIDTGIDSSHPAFEGRILKIWDQITAGSGVPEGAYGREFSSPAPTDSRDTQGHGTHVAGIAAGEDARFGGVAPEANIVFVKTDFMDAHIADGIRYIFRVAKDRNLPAVVNLSLGGHADAHDGTDPLSEMINQEVGTGRIVCCAAGNEGQDDIHARITATQGAVTAISAHVPSSMANSASVRIASFNGWYSGKDRMSIAIASPSGAQTDFQPILTGNNIAQVYTLPEGSVMIATPPNDPANGDIHFVVILKSGGGETQPIRGGNWQILIQGDSIEDGHVDIWVTDDSPGLDVIFTGNGVGPGFKIGSPGCASRAITVASYTSRVEWSDASGKAEKMSRLVIDDISGFSSDGPLRNGAAKPDVAAPGAMIAAPLSADSQVAPSFMIAPRFRLNAGTSMATPFITGIVALLLEQNSSLTPEEAKAMLIGACTIPGETSGAFHPKWGFGLLNNARL